MIRVFYRTNTLKTQKMSVFKLVQQEEIDTEINARAQGNPHVNRRS